MKCFILATVVLAVMCNAQQQRRVQKQYDQPQRQYEQPKQYDQQPQPTDQDFRQPIQVAEFKQAQQEYRPAPPPQEFRQGAAQQHAQEYRPKNSLETTTWIPIIKFDKEQETDGSYKTSYETGNNIIAEETGFLKNVGENDREALVQHGSYTYTSPEGQLITVEYTADEFGFRATGDHIPTPPPVSPEIQKGLDLIYAGIKANQERLALEEKANPEAFAKKQADRAALDYSGQYYQQ